MPRLLLVVGVQECNDVHDERRTEGAGSSDETHPSSSRGPSIGISQPDLESLRGKSKRPMIRTTCTW